MPLTLQEILIAPCVYLFVIFSLHRWMKHRNRINCKSVMIVYNLLQVCLSIYTAVGLFPIFSRGAEWWNFGGINTYNPDLYPFYMIHYYCKYLDYLDTIFIILLKDTKRLSILHISHHATVNIINGIPTLIGMTDLFIVEAFMNAGVHAVMYFHYLWTAAGLENRFKQWITRMQLIQFFIYVAQSICIFKMSTHPYAKIASVITALYTLFLIVMFNHFSRKEYVERRAMKASLAAKASIETQDVVKSQ